MARITDKLIEEVVEKVLNNREQAEREVAMAKLKLLGVQEEVVQGLVISVEPPARLCILLSNGEEIARGTMQPKDAEKWARRKCREWLERVGPEEAKRLGYDQPMELRIYDERGS